MPKALMWSSGCPTQGQFAVKNVFLALFWAYDGQQYDNNIGWATLMSFASIYPTHTQGPIPDIFEKKYRQLVVLKLRSKFDDYPGFSQKQPLPKHMQQCALCLIDFYGQNQSNLYYLSNRQIF